MNDDDNDNNNIDVDFEDDDENDVDDNDDINNTSKNKLFVEQDKSSDALLTEQEVELSLEQKFALLQVL